MDEELNEMPGFPPEILAFIEMITGIKIGRVMQIGQCLGCPKKDCINRVEEFGPDDGKDTAAEVERMFSNG